MNVMELCGGQVKKGLFAKFEASYLMAGVPQMSMDCYNLVTNKTLPIRVTNRMQNEVYFQLLDTTCEMRMSMINFFQHVHFAGKKYSTMYGARKQGGSAVVEELINCFRASAFYDGYIPFDPYFSVAEARERGEYHTTLMRNEFESDDDNDHDNDDDDNDHDNDDDNDDDSDDDNVDDNDDDNDDDNEDDQNDGEVSTFVL